MQAKEPPAKPESLSALLHRVAEDNQAVYEESDGWGKRRRVPCRVIQPLPKLENKHQTHWLVFDLAGNTKIVAEHQLHRPAENPF